MSSAGARVAILVATVLVGVSWWPLTTTHGWFVLAMGISAVSAGFALAAAAATRRAWVSSLVGGIVAALLLGMTQTPGALWLGVAPTSDALAEFARLWRIGMAQAETDTAPVAVEQPMAAVLVCSMVLLWWAGDLLGVASGHPAAAGLPLLAVFSVPASVLQRGLPTQYFVVAATGLFVLLLAGAAGYLQDWGRRADSGPAWPGWSAPAAAAAAVALAIALPAAVPGLSSGLVQQIRGDAAGSLGGSSGALSEDLDLRRDLTRTTDRPLLRFTTTAAQAQPLRMFTVESLDSDTWRAVAAQPSQLNSDGLLVLQPEPGEDLLLTTVRIEGLRQRSLPFPAPAAQIDVGGSWAYDPKTGTVRGGQPTQPDQQYEVLHFLPDASELRDAERAGVQPRWLDVPANTQRLTRQAQEIAGDATALQQAQRLQAFFRVTGDFTYTLDVPQQTGPSAMDDFLDRRSGYCVHYATAMTLMARSLGIPARVAVGTLPGDVVDTVDGQQVWEVSERDAHAWPELYFAGAGWVRFEPTPSARTGSAPPWSAEQAGSPAATAASPEAASTPAPGAERPAEQEPQALESGGDGTAPGPWIPVGIAALTVGVAVLARPLAVAARRRRRWASARTEGEIAEVAWADVTQRMAGLGVSWPASATVRSAEQLLGDELTGAAAKEALRRRGAALSRARYGAPVPVAVGSGRDEPGVGRAEPGVGPDGQRGPSVGALKQHARGDVREVVADVARGRGWRVRARAYVLPTWRG